MIDVLDSLQSDTDYDEDCPKPTPYAFQVARIMLDGCKVDGSVYPDGAGGLRVDWIVGDKELRLIIPAYRSIQGYIWHMQGNEHAIDNDVSMSNLNKWLNWLVETEG